jgi:hypothetical protein
LSNDLDILIQEENSMQKWEYLVVDTEHLMQYNFRVVRINTQNIAGNSIGFEEYLTSIGEQGWELLISQPIKAFGINGNRLIFKRPKAN